MGTKIKDLRRDSVQTHGDGEGAILAAKRYHNVAYAIGGVPHTGPRCYVDRLRAGGYQVNILADFDFRVNGGAA